MRKNLWILPVAFVAMGLMAGAAQAGSLSDYINDAGVESADDDNYEYIYSDGSIAGVLEVGDVLVGCLDVNKLNGHSMALEDGLQWTGIFAIEVAGIVNGADNLKWDATQNKFVAGTDGVIDTGDIVFKAYGGFGSYLSSIGVDDSGIAAVNTDVLIRMYLNDSSPYASPTAGSDQDDAIATFANGNWFWDLGFADPTKASHISGGNIVSDNGEGWVALADDSPGNVGNLLFGTGSQLRSGDEVGTGNFAVNRLAYGLGSWTLNPILLSDAKVLALGATAGDSAEFVGQSQVSGAEGDFADQGFDVTSSTQFNFDVVPLPAAVWPGMMMLFGLGAWTIRRRKAA
jgi:hypothetical protein